MQKNEMDDFQGYQELYTHVWQGTNKKNYIALFKTNFLMHWTLREG